MKICQINGGVYGSTGKIMFGITKTAEQNCMQVLCFSPVTVTNRFHQPKEAYQKIGTYRFRQISVFLSRLTGLHGCFPFFSTHQLLRKIKDFRPNIVHLHNLHDSYIHLPMLFRFLKKHSIKTVWTLHDCWAFTAYCPYFDRAECDRWQTGCHHCPQHHRYPKSYIDRSKTMYRLKKRWFTGLLDMTIVTPSRWLADLANRSYLRKYPVLVIHNGIDLEVFKPTESNLREKYQLGDKRIVLGVAFEWSEQKGLDVLAELARRLDPKEYQVILVGTTPRTAACLPAQILSIHRTQNQTELAALYTLGDVLVNPTREEVFGLVNVEALACGTPVVTFDTGGSPEGLDKTCGVVVPRDDTDEMERQVRRICQTQPFSEEACRRRAKLFDRQKKFEEYIALYRRKGSALKECEDDCV